MKKLFALLILALAACATSAPPPVANTPPPPAAAPQGFMPVEWDAANGKLLLHINRFNDDFLYVVSLPAGVGSNPIGLDRGELSNTHLVHFERIGPKVLLIESNTQFRALSNDPNERHAVEDSFARSVLWGFKVDKSEGDGVVVDATDFFLSDMHGVANRLRATQQGNYSVDKNRSAIYLPRTKSFPKNTEIEAMLTFETHDRPGPLVSGVTPVPQLVTVREHHSLVQLPPPGFKQRKLDPRVPFFGVEFNDYASPFTGPIEKRWIARHRLEKRDPNAPISEPIEPIVYYVDNGVPEPIRSALVEGASWWSAAFEAAGFRNAFQVKILPADADPMDIRYNMINWVHRSTRGWSYGEAVIDPRTGEIIKGNVRLGSLRIRQDVLIASGLIPQYQELDDRALAELDPATSPSLMALARIRQLAAHETGHTLGLAHNMAASSYERASVMDYPAPTVKITNGKLDLSDAYAKGIGVFDIFAIRFAYSQFPPGANEDAELDRIVRDAENGNPPMLFIKDEDARPVSAAHPLASVWDSPGDPVNMLRHEIEVRRIALEQFGLRNLALGEPLSSLEEKLVPLFLHHRFQLEAAAKSIGGVYYTYAVKEKGAIVPPEVRRIVPPARQRDAINAVISTLDPAFLQIPQRIIDLIPPRAFGYERGTAELFEKRTTPVFDPISAAMSSADITLGALLDPRRAARMDLFHAEDASNPDFNEVLGRLLDVVTHSGSISRATCRLAATRLMDLANNRDADPQVRAEASEALRGLASRLAAPTTDLAEVAHRHALRDDIQRFLERPDQPRTQPRPPEIPPGPPIGD
jgi:uncharacterized protein DUF4953/uncharacterized protein DUF5117